MSKGTQTGPKPKKYVFGFLDEVGLLHTPAYDRVFGLGLVKLHHPSILHRAIIDYRNKFRFRDEFKFRAVRQNNLSHYKRFVNLFFEMPFSEFSAMVIDKKFVNIETFFQSNHHRAYNSFVAKLIARSLEVSEYIVVLADDVSTPKSDNFEKEVKEKIKDRTRRNALFGICRLESHAVSEVQMADVLIGAVAYAFKIKYGLVKPSPKNAKFQLVKYIQKLLDQPALSETFERRMRAGRKFQVKEVDFGNNKK